MTCLIAPTERMPLRGSSVDLATVALALHWFDHCRFYTGLRRVVRLGGVLARWTYHLQPCPPLSSKKSFDTSLIS